MTRIYLAVGHGVKPDGVTYDPGAVSVDGKWSEQQAGDVIVAEAADELRLRGFEVKDEAFQNDPNYRGSVAAVNAFRADLAVEVHHDWSQAPEGAFAHWYWPEAKPLADAIQEAVGAAGFPLRPDWHKRRTDLTFIKTPEQHKVVLYECGRIGQPDLDSAEELRKMGRAIAAGIAHAAGYVPPSTREGAQHGRRRQPREAAQGDASGYRPEPAGGEPAECHHRHPARLPGRPGSRPAQDPLRVRPRPSPRGGGGRHRHGHRRHPLAPRRYPVTTFNLILAVLTGAVMPFVTPLLYKCQWPEWAKLVVVLLLAALVGFVQVAATGKLPELTLENGLQIVTLTYATSAVIFWPLVDGTGLRKYLEAHGIA